MKVLIIEDEPKIRRLLELELAHEGYQVETADNGRDGLAKALDNPWDLIVLDQLLPQAQRIGCFGQTAKPGSPARLSLC